MQTSYKYAPETLPRIICDDHPEWIELYNLAWKIGFGNIEYPRQAGWLPQLACIPDSGKIWQWDSCFMTLFARYANGSMPVVNNLDNLYRLQRQDGYLSMAYTMENDQDAYGERINPPLFAWVEWEYFMVSGDAARFEKIMPILAKYYDWIKRNRRRISGLYWFEDTGSTGMDNSPRSGYAAYDLKGSDVCFIDLACQQALSAFYLAKIAGYLKNGEQQAYFTAEGAALRKLINAYHWSAKAGFYFDLFSRSEADDRHNFLNVKTAAAFWAILANVADEAQVQKLVEHLLNPGEFWTPHPVASLSADDPNYDPQGGYWLGGVWPPINYSIAAGLKNRGLPAIAREIAVKHLAAMCEVMRNEKYGGTIWECYAPDFMLPATNKQNQIVRNNLVGWSGLGPIAMLIEHIFGLSFDAEANTVSWLLATAGRHGVQNLRFNGRTISLLCVDDARPAGRKILVHTSGDIRLQLAVAGRAGTALSRDLAAGEHELVV